MSQKTKILDHVGLNLPSMQVPPTDIIVNQPNIIYESIIFKGN
jgi:hypothetical protein